MCDDTKIQLFYDVGWLRQVRLEGKEKDELDEESQRQCDLFDNPEFQRRWVAEQVWFLVYAKKILASKLIIWG